MNLCRSLLAELDGDGRPLAELFDGCEGPRTQRLMRFARLGLLEVAADDRIHLSENGRRVSAALSSHADAEPPPSEFEALAAFERLVGRLIGPPLGAERSAA